MSLILIVDDMMTNAILLREMVKQIDGAWAVVFTECAETLAWCQWNEPDLALLDYVMPEMDGVELMRRLRALPGLETMPVIIVTAREDRSALYCALEAGANDFLTRPADELELLARSHNMLKLRAATRDLCRLATTDELTGLANRRHFLQRLDEEIQRALRYGEPMSLSLLDLDHFKRINDSHGHAVGDDMLRQAATTLCEAVRDVDVVGRIGGEEFAVLMPSTRLQAAHAVCERLRMAVERLQVWAGEATVTATISAGVGELFHGENGANLMARVDSALYRAKQRGRNRIETADAMLARMAASA